MKNLDNQFTIKEIERLCQLYMDCQLSVLEEAELEYTLMQSDFDSQLINETKKLMAVSRSFKLEESKPHKSVWNWVLRVAACAAIVLGAFAMSQHINITRDDGNCIVYVAGKRASAEEAHIIAEADVAKMQQFMQAVNEQKVQEEAKVEQFMNHINQSR